MGAGAQSLLRRPRLALFLSGRGSNARAIVEAIERQELEADPVLAVCNRAAAPGIVWMQGQGISTYVFNAKTLGGREAADRQLLAVLRAHEVDFIALAGYDRIVSPVLTQAYAGRIVNIHPSLLPKFGGPGMVGERVHTAVLAAGESTTGCSVHLVTEDVDGGPILGQQTVPVEPDDTPATLAARVLCAEHQLYPRILQGIISFGVLDASLVEALSRRD